jgi:rfaE bifunctional protein nucleotidyltransferase chain/domain
LQKPLLQFLSVGRVLQRQELQRELAAIRPGKRIVFTNGCFDLLHPGHLDLLERARALGDALVVGINSDAGVRALKGSTRPLTPESERAELLAALAAVDYVTFFDEPTPRELIIALKPEVLVKGGDWTLDTIVGREEVEAAGGEVHALPLLPGYSTTALVRKIQESPRA